MLETLIRQSAHESAAMHDVLAPLGRLDGPPRIGPTNEASRIERWFGPDGSRGERDRISSSYEPVPSSYNRRLTDSNDIAIPLVQSPQVHHLLTVPRPHRVPQHRRPAQSWPRVPLQRVKGGEPIEDDGRGEDAEIRGVADDQVEDRRPSRSTGRAQADRGDGGRDEQEEGVKGEIGRLVLAEDLVDQLQWSRL